jgi:protein TonB
VETRSVGRSPIGAAGAVDVPVGAPAPEVPAETAPPQDAASESALAAEQATGAVVSAPPSEAAAPTPLPPGVPGTDPDTLPRLLGATQPEYPAVAKRLGLEETVMLRVLIDEDGRVLEVEQLRGRNARADFLASAEKWVRAQRYAPATRDGLGVRFWLVQPVDYRLE